MFIFINNHEDKGITARYGFDSAILFPGVLGAFLGHCSLGKQLGKASVSEYRAYSLTVDSSEGRKGKDGHTLSM